MKLKKEQTPSGAIISMQEKTMENNILIEKDEVFYSIKNVNAFNSLWMPGEAGDPSWLERWEYWETKTINEEFHGNYLEPNRAPVSERRTCRIFWIFWWKMKEL